MIPQGASLSARWIPWIVVTLLTMQLLGCSTSAPAPEPVAEFTLNLRAVDWKATGVDVGRVEAVAESDGVLVVFTDRGASLMVAGVATTITTSNRAWRTAATIPAADGIGRWMVAVDIEGRIHRLKAQSSLEDISDRYGLAAERVREIVPIGGSTVAFGYEAGFAVADGSSVARYKKSGITSAAGGSGRLTLVAGDEIFVFDVLTSQMSSFRVPGARYATVDGSGKVVVATSQTLYRETPEGGLDVFHSASGEIRGMVVSGLRLWVAVGSEIATTNGAEWLQTRGAGISIGTKLVGSGSGDVWTLTTSGTLARYAMDEAGDIRLRNWQSEILPIVGRSCGKCHLPGGTAGVDLSTYAAWVTRRSEIEKRTVVDKSMPPAGSPLSDLDRAAIGVWIAASAK